MQVNKCFPTFNRYQRIYGVNYISIQLRMRTDKKIKNLYKQYSMNWIDVLSVLLGYKKPALIPIPKDNKPQKK